MLNKSEPQTLEEQKTELEFSMKESDYQTALRKEMEKIRKEGKITDRYEIIREAEMRIKKQCVENYYQKAGKKNYSKIFLL